MFYLYIKNDVTLPFTCDYKEVYWENKEKTIYMIGFKNEAWEHWEKNFVSIFWRPKLSTKARKKSFFEDEIDLIIVIET